MINPKITFVTCADKPVLAQGDRITYEYLENKGYNLSITIWNDPQVNWHDYDFIIIRSVWDYVENYKAFKKWLHHLQKVDAKVLNPVSMLLWNADKKYLLDLHDYGWPVYPFHIAYSVEETLEKAAAFKSREIILKPTVSAGSYLTYKVQNHESENISAFAANILQHSPVIIQPYEPVIADKGEYSYIFFNNVFSHAALKTPKQGDYRVQEEYGGVYQKVSPEPAYIQQFEGLLKKLSKQLLFARVDFVVKNNRPLLMELEILEPNLIIHPDAADARHFGDKIIEWVNSE